MVEQGGRLGMAPPLELSVVVVGDSGCGKTQLINRFANRKFSEVNTRCIVM